MCKYAINLEYCNESKMDAGVVSYTAISCVNLSVQSMAYVHTKIWSQSKIVRYPFCSFDTTGYHDNMHHHIRRSGWAKAGGHWVMAAGY